MRNRWGVEVKKGHWVRYTQPRGGMAEGRVSAVKRDAAYGPRVLLEGGGSCGLDDVSVSLGPMTVGAGGVVKQNPIDEARELFLYALHSSLALVKLSREALKGQRDWASVARQAARDYSKEHGNGAARWSEIFSTADLSVVASMLREHYESNRDAHTANPLVRVRVKAPPQRPAGNTDAPSARLVKRRKATNKKSTPRGFYANPRALRPFVSVEVMKADGGFKYGMDAVTPVRFEFTTVARERKGAYRSWKLPAEVVARPEFQQWARENGGQYFGSLKSLQRLMLDYMPSRAPRVPASVYE